MTRIKIIRVLISDLIFRQSKMLMLIADLEPEELDEIENEITDWKKYTDSFLDQLSLILNDDADDDPDDDPDEDDPDEDDPDEDDPDDDGDDYNPIVEDPGEAGELDDPDDPESEID